MFNSIFFLSLMQYPNDLLFLSLLKLLLFYFGSSFSLLIFDLLSNKKEIYSWMFGLFINSILFSFLIYFIFPNIGYLADMEHLFRGAFVHPNRIGMFLLPFCIFLFAYILNNKNKIFSLIILILTFIILFLSGARGSFVAFIIAVVITLIFAVFKPRHRRELKLIIENNLNIYTIYSACFFNHIFYILSLVINTRVHIKK